MPQDELGARREPRVDKKEEAPWVFLDGAADVAKALVQLLYESSREFFLVFFFKKYLARLDEEEGFHSDAVVSGFESSIQVFGG